MKKIITSTFMILILMGQIAVAQEELTEEVFDLSLEELMQMEVTSVSKKAERLQDVASSIYVVTSSDIEKSGATTIHEVLRNVPGYWGIQTEYNAVQASVRNSPVTNGSFGTVLYLLDGTSIQNLMGSDFSFGNFDIPLDEIDRIEVIRGSGGTIYGANSATGVISIFTKNPAKYDGVNVNVAGGNAGYINGSIRAGGAINEKVSLSAYGKVRSFGGFGSLAGEDENGNATVTSSRFVEDYEKSTMLSGGIKGAFQLSEASKLSFRTHYNSLDKFQYSNYFNTDFIFNQQDVLVGNEVDANRLVANIQYDLSFNDNHALFFRISTNKENDFFITGGGGRISNSMVDFEFQDNISIGEDNDLIFGANYRTVNFDVHDQNNAEILNYFDPQASESIKGIFAQDKLSLANGKFIMTLGIKAENYSLVNDEFYLSPMAKFTFKPTENLSIWGGFTQSYTTPGFTNTNIDLVLLQLPSVAEWTAMAPNIVFGQAYQGALDAGLDAAGAQAAAAAFVASPAGQATIQGTIAAKPLDIAVKNGSTTVPTKFSTFELGARIALNSMMTLESNFYYTNISDGIGVNPGDASEENVEMLTQPGRFADYFLYGNYVEGNTTGLETMMRIIPNSNLRFELSHSWSKSEWSTQDNEDFDISTLSADQIDQTPDTPEVPQHIVRLKTDYNFGSGFNANLGLIHASEFATQSNYILDQERYENIVESTVVDNINATTIAENNSRTIVNLRLNKKLMDDKLDVFVFGNDIFNKGIIANTNQISNVTLSQIGAMYGFGVNYKLK
jgi:outer membrane receptor for ferrienterochelin and colicin